MKDYHDEVAERIRETGMPMENYRAGTDKIAAILREAFPPSPPIGVDTPGEEASIAEVTQKILESWSDFSDETRSKIKQLIRSDRAALRSRLAAPAQAARHTSDNWHEHMVMIRNSDQWPEEMRRRAERWVQDPADRRLLIVDSWCEGQEEAEPMQKAGNMAYGEYVYLDDFQALAERFVLAWELITTSEEEPAQAVPSEETHLPWREALDIANAEIATLRAQLASEQIVRATLWDALYDLRYPGATKKSEDEIAYAADVALGLDRASDPRADIPYPAPDATALRETNVPPCPKCGKPARISTWIMYGCGDGDCDESVQPWTLPAWREHCALLRSEPRKE